MKMDQQNKIKIDSIFEEKLCILRHLSVEKFTSISDSYIKYKNRLISFIEIVRETLNFEPSPENCSMEICEQCKVKLQDFYNFKMRFMAAKDYVENSCDLTKNGNLKELNDSSEGTEWTILEIIRNYIKTYSIKHIEFDENSKRLVIFSNDSQAKEDEYIEMDKSEEIEYLVECLEEDSAIDQEIIENDTEFEEIIESQEMDFEDDTESLSQSLSSNSYESLKRPRNPEEWACNKRKKLRNLGKSYLNSKGKIVSERKMLESCAKSNCRSNCQIRLSENDRLMNFSNYWKLGDVVEQRKFIYNHILTKEPMRRKSINSKARSVTLQFYLDICDPQGNISCVHVCKKMFKNTLAISNQVIQGVISKYANSGFTDPRGKHQRKLTEAQELARQHVQKFPFFYVEQNMTKVQLYNMYVDECTKKNIEPVKESNYREIFDKFNANSFLKTEKILCKKCHKYYNSTDEQRKLLQIEHNQHLEEDKKCKDRALGRIRHKRAMERRKSEKLNSVNDS